MDSTHRPLPRKAFAALLLCLPLARIALVPTPAFAGAASEGELESSLRDLRKTPQDESLRRKIIALVLAMPSKPPVPGEASELKGWADAALKDAKTHADYLAAARAYRQSLVLAPWAAAGYLGLATALERAGDARGAADGLRFYLLCAPAAPDAGQVSERLGALEYRAEKTASVDARPAGDGPAPVAVALDRFKKLAFGDYKKAYDCGHDSPIQALRKRERMQCDQAEYDGGRWYPYDVLGSREFRFPEDGTIEFWEVRSVGRSLELLGKPQGPRLEDIEWFRCDGPRCAKPVWVRFSDDLGAITWSLDRPVDDSAFDPKARYAYRQYRRR